MTTPKSALQGVKDALSRFQLRKALYGLFTAVRWLWSIPFIRSAVGTQLARAGIIGAVLLALAEKAFG